MAVKSGTNEIHGGLYEFIRNDVLDARNFFDQNQTDLTTGAQVPGTARPPFRRNQFGFFAGGPIRKDKTFIFGDYQGTRIREGLTNLDTVPTNAERGGDFSDRLAGANFSPCGDLGQIGVSDPVYDTGTIFNPFTTRNFTCSNGTVVLLRDPLSSNGRLNVIPPNLINAVGQNVINVYPTATLPGITNNLLLNPGQSNDQDSFDVHFDNRFSDQDQFFVSYSYGSVRSILPGPLGVLGLLPQQQQGRKPARWNGLDALAQSQLAQRPARWLLSLSGNRPAPEFWQSFGAAIGHSERQPRRPNVLRVAEFRCQWLNRHG